MFIFRQCPRLNKRYKNVSAGTTAAEKVLEIVIQNVMKAVESKPLDDHQNVEATKIDPKLKGSTVWTCPLCFVQIRQKQNIPRHKNLNCASVKVKKVKSPKQQIPAVFKYKHCGADYPLKKTLISHYKNFHMEQYCLENKESLFQCSLCDFKTLAEKYLKQHHSKFHMEKGSFSCDNCEKVYFNKDSLRVHVKRSHLIAKPASFVCEVCGSRVSSGSNCHFCDSSENCGGNIPTQELDVGYLNCDQIYRGQPQCSYYQIPASSSLNPNYPPNTNYLPNSYYPSNANSNYLPRSPNSTNVNSNNFGDVSFQELIGTSGSSEIETSQFSELPSYLTSQLKFPCKLEINAGGGPSLYRAAGQHVGLGQEVWPELRRYCHAKLEEWWEWYQPYYTFPLQVKVRIHDQTVQKTIPSSPEFLKFLKTEESLSAFPMSVCELFCLANVLGFPIYQLTYNLVEVKGKTKEHGRWDTLEPHPSLIHVNKFSRRNKEPFYILYEDEVHFCKIVLIK